MRHDGPNLKGLDLGQMNRCLHGWIKERVGDREGTCAVLFSLNTMTYCKAYFNIFAYKHTNSNVAYTEI